MIPCVSWCASVPCSDAKPPSWEVAADATAATATVQMTARSCSRRRTIVTSATIPAKYANSAPRETARYRPVPSGALAQTAATRRPRGRVMSPAIRASSTSPIAASSPSAFQ